MEQETLKCVGGPFDGEYVEVERFNFYMVKVSMPDTVASVSNEPQAYLFKHKYERDPKSGYPAVWRFVKTETLYLDLRK